MMPLYDFVKTIAIALNNTMSAMGVTISSKVKVSNFKFRMIEKEKTKENAVTPRSIRNTIQRGVDFLSSLFK